MLAVWAVLLALAVWGLLSVDVVGLFVGKSATTDQLQRALNAQEQVYTKLNAQHSTLQDQYDKLQEKRTEGAAPKFGSVKEGTLITLHEERLPAPDASESVSEGVKDITAGAAATEGVKDRRAVHVLAAPFGPEDGLFRRLLRIDDAEAFDVCGHPFTLEWASTVPDTIATADIVWIECVHVAQNIDALRAKLSSLGIKKPASQRWMCVSVETSVYYPWLYPFAPLKQQYPEIDVFSTNRLDSGIPLIEIGNEYNIQPQALLDTPATPFKDKIPKALTMYSNCDAKSGRQDYILPFVQAFPSLVANHGKCWGGQSQNDPYSESGVQEKQVLTGKYMFSFCLENSYVTDYVSEKVFQALALGSVPIYKGAPNAAKDFIPCEHCVIWVDDYPTADKLGEYLKYLISNQTAYEEYFAWKQSPREDVISTLERYSLDSALCRWTNLSALKPLKSIEDTTPTWLPFVTPCPPEGSSSTVPLYGCSDAKRVFSNVPQFTADQAKGIVNRFRSVVFLGDSLTRQSFHAFLMLVNGDAATGALRGKYSYFKEEHVDTAGCEYEALNRHRNCTSTDGAGGRGMAWDNIYGYEQSPRVVGCPYSDCAPAGGCRPDFANLTSGRGHGNMLLYTWYEATCRMHALEVVRQLTAADAVVVGEGIHDNFNTDAFRSYLSEDFLHEVRIRNISLVVLKAVAAGRNKPAEHVASQGTAAAAKFNTFITAWASEAGVQTLDAFDMTLDAKSIDGTHYELDVNFMRASQVLGWLQGLTTNFTRNPI